jgi:hypothetical protein
MLSAGRCIGVQADAEGRRGAVARRTRAGIDQAADKPGFPALERAVFNPPEEVLGCKVAIEATAHFGGIAAETGEEIEAFLQLGIGSEEQANSRTLSKCSWFSMINIQCSPFTVEIAAVEAARGAAGVHSRSLSSHCQGSDRGFTSTPLLDGLAHRLDPTAGDRQSRNQPMGVSS